MEVGLGVDVGRDGVGHVVEREVVDRMWISELVTQLPAVEREACTLVYIQGMSPAQAAAELDTTPNNVHQRLFHARRRLKETIGGDD